MNISITGIFEFFNASPMDAMIVVIAVMLVFFCRSMIHQIREATKDKHVELSNRIHDLKNETIKHHDELKARVKKLDHQYKQVDKLTLILSHEVHHLGGAQTVKLNHNGEHEIINPILEPSEVSPKINEAALSAMMKEALQRENKDFITLANCNSRQKNELIKLHYYLETKGLTSDFQYFVSQSVPADQASKET